MDEVWSEIHKGQGRQQNGSNSGDIVQNPEAAPRQPTFGEMTLEDFLVKAGVVRESYPVTAPTSQQQYSLCPNNDHAARPSFVPRTLIGMPSVAGAGNAVVLYQAAAPGVGEPSGYTGRVVHGGDYDKIMAAVLVEKDGALVKQE